MTTEAAVRRFFSSDFFAVVGASSNPAKYGNIVLAWYINQGLKVTPVNPISKTVDVLGEALDAVARLSDLPADKIDRTSVSFVTPPQVTRGVLEEADRLRIPAVWLQPGSFDEEVISWARQNCNFEAVVAGDGGRGGEGWCVLVDGRAGLKAAGKL